MIKVFVVDDEKLVRRGIIGLIEWEKYGMQVIGDSGSTQETLEFLKQNEVDLLFSDLEMPGISGIPFLKEVKKICPKIQIVVLTMHQEFELIQQSLRVGILDYITKAQIEGESIDAFMKGIRERYLENVRHTTQEVKKLRTDKIYILKTEEKQRDEQIQEGLERKKIPFEKLDEKQFLLLEQVDLQQIENEIRQSGRDHVLIILEKVRGLTYSQLEELLKGPVKRRLFEERKSETVIYHYAYPELLQIKPGENRKKVLEDAMKMEFVLLPEYYEATLQQICHAALTNEERVAAFYHFNLYWSEFSKKDFTKYFEEVSGFHWWYEWRAWFDAIRKDVLKKIGEDHAEIEVIQAVHQAMNYIREHMNRDITLEELLRLTGMSKSFFSKNFKQITGKTFVTYMNDLRIETAEKYLRETKQPIYWIASQVGYLDEHYFRRVFKERTGLSPRRFREKYQEERGIEE